MEKQKRELCPTCLRPLKTCLCTSVEKIDNNINILVLRHKSEKSHALNTVRPCELCLTNIKVHDGENFDDNEDLDYFIKKNALLVFPTSNATDINQVSSQGPKESYFILIDGTWNKAKKIFFETKKLQTLRSITFTQETKSNYRIRKSNFENGLSTLECIELLGRTFDQEIDYSPLIKVFNFMIERQIKLMGEDTYNANYKKGKPN